MYRMNTRMLLAIVATTAALTIITSSIGVGIFSQQANAAPNPNSNGATNVNAPRQGTTCIIYGPTGPPNVFATTNEFHAVINHGGQTNFACHTP